MAPVVASTVRNGVGPTGSTDTCFLVGHQLQVLPSAAVRHRRGAGALAHHTTHTAAPAAAYRPGKGALHAPTQRTSRALAGSPWNDLG